MRNLGGLGSHLLGRSRGGRLLGQGREASGLVAQGWWIPDHKPRRFPETKEERRQAALKYGLKEEDYEPYPMGWDCAGEYPNLGRVAHIHKDPYENWSHEHWRRNYGEPMPKEFAILTPDRQNYSGLEFEQLKFEPWKPILKWVGGLSLVFYLLAVHFKDRGFIWVGTPWMPKQVPYDFKRSFPFEDPRAYPIVNYSFEPATPKQ